MNRQITEYVGIAINLVLFSLILSTIVYFSGAANAILGLGVEKEAFKQELSMQRELSVYDNKVITGDDVLVAVKKYTQIYDMSIDIGLDIQTGNLLWKTMGVNDSNSVWDVESVRQSMGQYIYTNYTATLKKDFSDAVIGLVFTRVQ